jgi:hypothetical protein
VLVCSLSDRPLNSSCERDRCRRGEWDPCLNRRNTSRRQHSHIEECVLRHWIFGIRSVIGYAADVSAGDYPVVQHQYPKAAPCTVFGKMTFKGAISF